MFFSPFFCLPYSAIWIHKRVQEVPEYGSRFPSTGPSSRVRILTKITEIFKKLNFFFKSLIFFYKTVDGQFAMSPGSYDPNLGSEILILGWDIRSRSWPNIDGTYGSKTFICKYMLCKSGKEPSEKSKVLPSIKRLVRHLSFLIIFENKSA